MKTCWKLLIVAGGLLASAFIQTSYTDGTVDSGGSSAAELAKASQNPIANMISVPFQNNTNREQHQF